MPKRKTKTKRETRQTLKNVSFESMVICWLMQDGWQVFTPVLDNGHQTDILISDGPNYYRVQIKTVLASGKNHTVSNSWEESDIDVVVFFARNSTWGYVMPAFTESRVKLNRKGHYRFKTTKKDFLKAFHEL